MPGMIADGVTVNDGQRAVIEKHNFEVRIIGDQFELTDLMVRRAKGSKGAAGRTLSGNLDALLTTAVEVRQAHEATVAAKPAKAAQPAAQKTDPKAEKGKKAATPAAATEPPAAKPPAAEIEGAELNDTGKRAGKRREKKAKAPKGPRNVRYTRAAKVLVKNLGKNGLPAIDQATLSKLAAMKLPTAGHCLDAWNCIVAVLGEAGMLKIPGYGAAKVTKTDDSAA